MTPEDSRARNRFIVIQITRIAGVALILLGMLVLAGRLDWPKAVGPALMVIGLVDAFVIPVTLARRWKSPSE